MYGPACLTCKARCVNATNKLAIKSRRGVAEAQVWYIGRHSMAPKLAFDRILRLSPLTDKCSNIVFEVVLLRNTYVALIILRYIFTITRALYHIR